MSKQDELKTQLEQAKKDLHISIAAGNKEINRINKEIAEAAKPKLVRDGDYSVRGMGEYVHIRLGGRLFNQHGGENPSGYDPAMDIKAGNLVDDLKALQEDVTEFEVKDGSGQNDIRVDFTEKHVRIKDKDAGGHLAITIENLPAFILGLSQMEATNKRNKK